MSFGGDRYAVVDDALSPDFPLGVERETFIRREDAERFVEEVHGDDLDLASYLRIEEGRPRRTQPERKASSRPVLAVNRSYD